MTVKEGLKSCSTKRSRGDGEEDGLLQFKKHLTDSFFSYLRSDQPKRLYDSWLSLQKDLPPEAGGNDTSLEAADLTISGAVCSLNVVEMSVAIMSKEHVLHADCVPEITEGGSAQPIEVPTFVPHVSVSCKKLNSEDAYQSSHEHSKRGPDTLLRIQALKGDEGLRFISRCSHLCRTESPDEDLSFASVSLEKQRSKVYTMSAIPLHDSLSCLAGLDKKPLEVEWKAGVDKSTNSSGLASEEPKHKPVESASPVALSKLLPNFVQQSCGGGRGKIFSERGSVGVRAGVFAAGAQVNLDVDLLSVKVVVTSGETSCSDDTMKDAGILQTSFMRPEVLELSALESSTPFARKRPASGVELAHEIEECNPCKKNFVPSSCNQVLGLSSNNIEALKQTTSVVASEQTFSIARDMEGRSNFEDPCSVSDKATANQLSASLVKNLSRVSRTPEKFFCNLNKLSTDDYKLSGADSNKPFSDIKLLWGQIANKKKAYEPNGSHPGIGAPKCEVTEVIQARLSKTSAATYSHKSEICNASQLEMFVDGTRRNSESCSASASNGDFKCTCVPLTCNDMTYLAAAEQVNADVSIDALPCAGVVNQGNLRHIAAPLNHSGSTSPVSEDKDFGANAEAGKRSGDLDTVATHERLHGDCDSYISQWNSMDKTVVDDKRFILVGGASDKAQDTTLLEVSNASPNSLSGQVGTDCGGHEPDVQAPGSYSRWKEVGTPPHLGGFTPGRVCLEEHDDEDLRVVQEKCVSCNIHGELSASVISSREASRQNGACERLSNFSPACPRNEASAGKRSSDSQTHIKTRSKGQVQMESKIRDFFPSKHRFSNLVSSKDERVGDHNYIVLSSDSSDDEKDCKSRILRGDNEKEVQQRIVTENMASERKNLLDRVADKLSQLTSCDQLSNRNAGKGYAVKSSRLVSMKLECRENLESSDRDVGKGYAVKSSRLPSSNIECCEHPDSSDGNAGTGYAVKTSRHASTKFECREYPEPNDRHAGTGYAVKSGRLASARFECSEHSDVIDRNGRRGFAVKSSTLVSTKFGCSAYSQPGIGRHQTVGQISSAAEFQVAGKEGHQYLARTVIDEVDWAAGITCDFCGGGPSLACGEWYAWCCGQRKPRCLCPPHRRVLKLPQKSKSALPRVVNGYVHRMCAIWSAEVVEHNDYLKDLSVAVRRGLMLKCGHCQKFGATLGCRVAKCRKSFHYPCADLLAGKLQLRMWEGYTVAIACKDHLHVDSVSDIPAKQIDLRGSAHALGYLGFNLICEDMSYNQEGLKIPCTNDVDDEPLPKMKYITKCRYRKTGGVMADGMCPGKAKPAEGCNGCTEFDLHDPAAPISVHVPCTSRCADRRFDWQDQPMYGRLSYDEYGRLQLGFETPDIIECNTRCKCGPACKNRVLQDGLRVRLEVFRTTNRGWGVRTIDDLPRGTFVVEYVGELLTHEEAEVRGEKYDAMNHSCLFNLDHPDVPQDEILVLDGHSMSNVARFINHSCDGNLVTCRVYTESREKKFCRIGMYANRDIWSGTELSYDYNYSTKDVPQNMDDIERILQHPNTIKCHCGASNCRRVLWGGGPG